MDGRGGIHWFFAALFALALLTRCAPPQLCSAATCQGCCRAGVCVQGEAIRACGSGGAVCSSCSRGQLCSAGTCSGR